MTMLSWAGLQTSMAYLKIGTAALAHEMGVTRRTVQRWKSVGVPGPASAAVRAWMRLEERGMPWRKSDVMIHVPTMFLLDEKRPARATGDWADVWALEDSGAVRDRQGAEQDHQDHDDLVCRRG